MNDERSKCENENRTGEPAENSAPGLNDNLEFLGKQLHVQTERIGFPTPRIVTQVFSNGRVVFSKKYDLPGPGIDSPGFARVQQLMRTQHLQTIREIQEKQKRILGSTAVL
jgi:hypothetical protein